jgi:PHO85 cyclin-5
MSGTRPLNIYSRDYSSPDDEPVYCLRSRAVSSRYSPSSSSDSSSSSRSSVPSSVSSSSLLSSSASAQGSLSNGIWQNEASHKRSLSQIHFFTQGTTLASDSKSVCSDSVADNATHHLRSEARQPEEPEAVPVEHRQHPRRTQRVINGNNKDGGLSIPCTRAPPTLVRQSERKDVFVDSLVGKTLAC